MNNFKIKMNGKLIKGHNLTVKDKLYNYFAMIIDSNINKAINSHEFLFNEFMEFGVCKNCNQAAEKIKYDILQYIKKNKDSEGVLLCQEFLIKRMLE